MNEAAEHEGIIPREDACLAGTRGLWLQTPEITICDFKFGKSANGRGGDVLDGGGRDARVAFFDAVGLGAYSAFCIWRLAI